MGTVREIKGLCRVRFVAVPRGSVQIFISIPQSEERKKKERKERAQTQP